LSRGQVIDYECLKNVPVGSWQGANIKADMEVIENMESIALMHQQKIEKLDEVFKERIKRLDIGDELSPGVIKLVKVFVAVKRKTICRRQDGRSPWK